MPEPLVAFEDLSVSYGPVEALAGVTGSFPSGPTGLLGPNGAGKTTLLKTLLGFLRPDRGRLQAFGFDPAVNPLEVRRRIGYMPEVDCHVQGMTAAAFVAFAGELSGLPRGDAISRAHEVLYYVGLEEARYRNLETYSTGMKQRVKLAQAIVHDPGLVFLDEPTNGMDPQGREDMLELIIRIHRMLGMAVVVSSHILEDIERVCDFVIIINDGKLVLAQPIGHDLGQTSTDLLVRVDGDPAAFIARIEQAGFQAGPSRDEEARALGEIAVRFDGDQTYDAVRDAAVDLGMALRTLRTRARSLEDLYLGNIEGDGASDGRA